MPLLKRTPSFPRKRESLHLCGEAAQFARLRREETAIPAFAGMTIFFFDCADVPANFCLRIA
jgi:hypothetical protein